MNSRNLILWVVLALSLIFVIPQVIILIVLGMAPTIVAYIVDKSNGKFAFFSVGAMNLTGITPGLIKLWNGENTVSAAIDILSNPFDLLIIFAAAALGWLIYLGLPPVIRGLLTIISKHRITNLKMEQKRLVKEWGEGVAIGPRAIELQEASKKEDFTPEENLKDLPTDNPEENIN